MHEISILALLILLVLFLLGPGRRFGRLSGVSLFLYAQTAMAFGTIPLLDPHLESDRMHCAVIVLTYFAYVITTVVASLLAGRFAPRTTPPEVDVFHPGLGTWCLLLLSAGISVLYFSAIGYVAFVESLRGALSNSPVDAATLRLESYTGSRYLFPGYVNQFKNSLLPALVAVVIPSLFARRVPGRVLITGSLVLLSTFLLLGTGQRGAFVTFLLVTIVYLSIAYRSRFRAIALWIGAAGTLFFFLATIASGRAAAELQAAASPLDKLAVLTKQLVYRILGSNQESSVAGFRYIYDRPVQYGRDWAESFLGLLPGVRGSDLDNHIFATLYGGSLRGTSPPSIWGSSYYNFGLLGSVVLAVVLALVLLKVAQLGSRVRRMSTLQAVGLAGMHVVLGTWIAGTPTYLLNFGLGVYLLLWLWGRSATRRLSGGPDGSWRGAGARASRLSPARGRESSAR